MLLQRELWSTPAQWNRAGRLWLDTVANVRIHGTTGERPVDRLPREGLVPLSSVRAYDLAWVEPRRVSRDGRFSWEGNRYSVPWQYGSTAVLVRRLPEGRLEVERNGELLATHRERPPGRGETVVLPEHVAGLWQRTLGRKRAYEPPESVTAVLPEESPFPVLEVEHRDLAVYQALLEEAPV